MPDVDVVALVKEKFSQLDVVLGDVTTRLQTLDERTTRLKEATMRPPSVFGLHGQPDSETLGALVTKSAEVKQFAASRMRGAAVVAIPGRLVQKATITTGPGSGLLPGVTVAPISPLAQAPLALVNLIPSRVMSEGSLQFVRQKAPHATAAIQVSEGDLKQETAMVFETISLIPETLACWIPASRQALQDIAGLQLLIDFELLYALRVLEEQEILNGTGPQGHLTGLLPAATVVAPVAGDTGIDAIARLLGSLTAQGIRPTGVVLHPSDWLKMTLAKGTTNEYLLGSPASSTTEVLWGVSMALSAAIPAGTALVGDFLRGAELGYREDASVQISTEHADFFVRNLVAIRAEERLVLAIRQPSFFAKMTLPTP